MHKNAIKIEWGVIFLWFEGENLAIFPRFEPKTVAKLAIFSSRTGDFQEKISANTGRNKVKTRLKSKTTYVFDLFTNKSIKIYLYVKS